MNKWVFRSGADFRPPLRFRGDLRRWILRIAGLAALWVTSGYGPPTAEGQTIRSDAVQRLAEEVGSRGWIVYGARSELGDWDLFLCRPDGSSRRPLTETPQFNEFAPQFSHDGRRLLYRRVLRNEPLSGNRYGEQGELVLANADGSAAVALGKPGELPWASFGPDGAQIASLSIQGISFLSIDRPSVIRTLPRKGFFQQMIWSPDGAWLVGVANAFGTGWSIARMNVATGEAQAVNTVDCCTPDWYPDSRRVIFSWRPPGQTANEGHGWTQLWMADATGENRRLVYGEDGRHVYGGHASPDGQYVLFTGNVEEDGDPGRAGAPMGLMRLSDAPIIPGQSTDLRAQHPEAKGGPVLTLPAGWEPCWTFSEMADAAGSAAPAATEDLAALRAELHNHGRLVFSAKSATGDWDLFFMRPDGSDRRPVTVTPEFNEAGARFSPDGRRLLYYRMPKSEAVDNNTYGTFGLVLANADGGAPVILGDSFQWASWGPDGRQIACLAPQGIRIMDVATTKVVREFPRRGIVSQLVWSPDGREFTGTANGLGPFWNIGCLNPASGEIRAVSETERYNCTPDWAPDARRILYARGIIPEQGGYAELWMAEVDGTERRRLYAEPGRHIYGACASPDGRYLLFTRSAEDLGEVPEIAMAIIRWSDTPLIVAPDGAPNQTLANARRGPRLDLGPGWEPHWIAQETAP